MTKLFVRQKGAGNGKTYDAIQLLNNEDEYETKLYLTKAHSAVHVIKQEFDGQLIEDKLDISIISEEYKTKKHDIKYYTEPRCSKRAIIATVDSFIYSIADKNVSNCIDKFKAWIKSVIDQIKVEKEIQFTKDGLFLEKTLIIGDEMQDLSKDYMEALIKVIKDTGADMYIVGDKLQSISIPYNAFTMIYDLEIPSAAVKTEEYSHFTHNAVDIYIYNPVNESNRFESHYLIKFLNHLIPFQKMKLPKIKVADYKEGPFTDNPNDLCVFRGKWIGANSTNKELLSIEADKVVNLYIKEVEDKNRKPNDFIFITPFVKKNPLMETICLKIREYWESVNPETNDYIEYCIFHKSEDGKSIDLSESDEYTRCVSIHSSKGDGRPVAFMIGFTESALRVYSCEKNNLIYESLLHVGATRFKQKLYIRVECNNDDIHTRIYDFLEKEGLNNTLPPPIIHIKKNIKLDDIIQVNHLNNYEKLYENIIINSDYDNYDIDEEACPNSNKRILDIKHHKIRYSALLISSILLIYKKTLNNKQKNQLTAIFHKIKDCDIVNVTMSNKYLEYLDHEIYPNILPLLDFSKKGGDYAAYNKFLNQKINTIQKHIDIFINNDYDIINELEWIDLIILYFMIEIINNGRYSDITINDMYDIIHINDKCNDDENKGYKQKYYEQIEYLDEIWDNIIKENSNMRFLINHQISYSSSNLDYKIYNNISIIGYNDRDVVLFRLKPQFSSLNYGEILIESIYNDYLIKNTNEKVGNYDRFNGKEIYTCVLSLELNKPYYINWENNNDFIKKNLYENMKLYYISKNNNIISFYEYFHDFHKTQPNKMMKKMFEWVPESPNYVREYFVKLKHNYEINKDKDEKIKFLDEKRINIKNELENIIDRDLCIFFNLEVDENDDY